MQDVSLDGARFQIADALRSRVEWKRVNLAGGLGAMPPQHLILCRNVMIYFDAELRERLTSELYRATRDGGYVYVGGTETLDMKRTRFQYVGPSIFQKKEAGA